MPKFLRTIFFLLAFFLIWSLISPKQDNTGTDDIVLSAKSKISIGRTVNVDIINNSDQTLTFASKCPSNPLTVEKYTNGQWIERSSETDKSNCTEDNIVVETSKNYEISYDPWNNELFDEIARYRISLNTTIDGADKIFSKEIEVKNRGILRAIWQEGFYKPIFNTLIFFISVLPGNSLGWAILLLTFVIKVILLAPNQKALKSQKKMQKVQPELNALKKKYQDNPQKLTEETMKIWKKYKVNPMGSCLPMIIQFPVLIALFYVVKNGLGFINPQLLYEGLKGFDPSTIQPVFLGIIDLTQVNIIVLPIIIGLLQFGQMKLTLGKGIKNQSAGSPMPMMNKTMMYFMPILIAIFTAGLPAAVGFYWGTSTLFGIGQQIVVNRSKD